MGDRHAAGEGPPALAVGRISANWSLGVSCKRSDSLDQPRLRVGDAPLRFNLVAARLSVACMRDCQPGP